jgi:hypothetical protein
MCGFETASNAVLSIVCRVTRLGEFSPFGRLFSLGSFLKGPEAAEIFGPRFSAEKDKNELRHKTGLAPCWAFFHKLIRSP